MHAKLLLLVTAYLEAAAGLFLLLLPTVVFAVLLGLDHAAVDTIFVGRLTGTALLAMHSQLDRENRHADAGTPRIAHRGFCLRRGGRNAPCIRWGGVRDDRHPALARGCTSCRSCDSVLELPADSSL